MKLLKVTTTLLVFQLVLCTLAFAQDANSILKKVSDQHNKMVDQVDDMQLVMRPDGDLGGFDKMISYYKKEMVDGEATFRTYTKFEGGMGELANQSSATTQSMDMFALGAKMHEAIGDAAKYEGVEDVDGIKTDVIYVADMTDLMSESWGQFETAGDETRVKDVRMYIDQKKHVVRKVSMTAQVSQQGTIRDMNTTIIMSDYRQVGPVYQPFAMKTIMENPMTDDQRAEIEQQREQIEAMLSSLPENQQGPIKKMLDALGGEEIEISMIVEDLKINEGVPAEYFE
ncbi:MAG: hypothetical protein KTR29_13275 [Rhodothermaceae bacterium]|nr:hypothetical protein [Rhodothermaceae bacterium]